MQKKGDHHSLMARGVSWCYTIFVAAQNSLGMSTTEADCLGLDHKKWDPIFE